MSLSVVSKSQGLGVDGDAMDSDEEDDGVQGKGKELDSLCWLIYWYAYICSYGIEADSWFTIVADILLIRYVNTSSVYGE
jgi:hypothetical protein